MHATELGVGRHQRFVRSRYTAFKMRRQGRDIAIESLELVGETAGVLPWTIPSHLARSRRWMSHILWRAVSLTETLDSRQSPNGSSGAEIDPVESRFRPTFFAREPIGSMRCYRE